MPYKDPEKRKRYHREYQRLYKRGVKPGKTRLAPEVRWRTAEAVVAMLSQQLDALLIDSDLDSVTRARTVTYVAGTLLKAIETADHEQRLEALEEQLRLRKVG